jgi:hypothetical protein
MTNVRHSIFNAFQKGTLKEPFTSSDFKKACPGWAESTYNTFLWKHRKNNPGGYSELFVLISSGKFKILKDKII